MAAEQSTARSSVWAEQGGHYEYRVLTFPHATSRAEAWRTLTEHAEYGRWELARSVLYVGGVQRVWLRRKVIRVRSTLAETT